MKKIFLLGMIIFCSSALHAAPKKLLVVETTTGFRHDSIPYVEKLLTELASSTGEFTLDFIRQPDGKPNAPGPNATDVQKEAFQAAYASWNKKLEDALQKLSPESLKNYDGVFFDSTTGDLPIPAKQGFLDWISAGHAFIGVHAASDTFHNWPAFIDMIGGEFETHGKQVPVDDLVQDAKNPSTRPLPKTWSIKQEEIYEFKNYDPAKVHNLLIMDKHPQTHAPGLFPVAWTKEYGKGRVFYTALGHREDIVDADPNLPDRINSVETAQLYRKHLLGGIEWALGLKK